MSEKKTVIVFTDGACSGNPGPGGWGVLLQWNGKETELTGGAPDTTNNRMEIQAGIEALNALNQPCRVRIHSDSALIVHASQQRWLNARLQRGRINDNTKPVGNRYWGQA